MMPKRKISPEEMRKLRKLRNVGRKCAKKPYAATLHRMREIEAVVKDRFNAGILPAYKAERYLEAIAFAANAMNKPLSAALYGWCERFAPTILDDFDAAFEPIRMKVEGRRWNLSAKDVADLLGVTWEERQRLGLRTIAACDLTAEEFTEARKEAKRQRDRDRVAEKRARRMSRDEYRARPSLEKERPWEVEGISRRTWYYRRRKEDCTGLSQRAQGNHGDIALDKSRIGNLTDEATHPVQRSIEPSINDLTSDLGGRDQRPAGDRPPSPNDSEKMTATQGRHEASDLEVADLSGGKNR